MRKPHSGNALSSTEMSGHRLVPTHSVTPVVGSVPHPEPVAFPLGIELAPASLVAPVFGAPASLPEVGIRHPPRGKVVMKIARKSRWAIMTITLHESAFMGQVLGGESRGHGSRLVLVEFV
jgi:hypothetical protein